MAMFKYTAVSGDGQRVRASVEGVSLASAENELLRQNLQIVKIREKKGFSKIEISPERVPRQEIMHFSRQIAAFVRTGIPIVDAVRVVEEGTDNKRFKTILVDVRQQLEGGVPFSEALAPHKDVFPSYYLGILRSAELTGQLDTVLDQLSLYIERDLEARSKIKSRADLPHRDHGDGDRHHGGHGGRSCCRASWSSSRTSTPSCPCPRGCCSASATSSRPGGG